MAKSRQYANYSLIRTLQGQEREKSHNSLNRIHIEEEWLSFFFCPDAPSVGWAMIKLSLMTTFSETVISTSRNSGFLVSSKQQWTVLMVARGLLGWLIVLGRGVREHPPQVTVNCVSACEECWTRTINNAATFALEFGTRVEFAASRNLPVLNADLRGGESQTHSHF